MFHNVCTRLLQMFCQCVVASVIFIAVVRWGGGSGRWIETNDWLKYYGQPARQTDSLTDRHTLVYVPEDKDRIISP